MFNSKSTEIPSYLQVPLTLIGAVLVIVVLQQYTPARTIIAPQNPAQNTAAVGDAVATLPTEVSLQDMKVIIPEYSTVTLVNGSATFDVGTAQSPLKGTVTLLPNTVFQNDTQDVIAPFNINYGGSGIFQTLIIFQKNGNALVQKDLATLGDRITISNITVSPLSVDGSYTLTAKLLVRQNDEPIDTPPTVETTVTYHIRDHHFSAN